MVEAAARLVDGGQTEAEEIAEVEGVLDLQRHSGQAPWRIWQPGEAGRAVPEEVKAIAVQVGSCLRHCWSSVIKQRRSHPYHSNSQIQVGEARHLAHRYAAVVPSVDFSLDPHL